MTTCWQDQYSRAGVTLGIFAKSVQIFKKCLGMNVMGSYWETEKKQNPQKIHTHPHKQDTTESLKHREIRRWLRWLSG